MATKVDYEKFQADLDSYLAAGGRVDSIRECDDRGSLYGVDFQYVLMNRWAMDRLSTLNAWGRNKVYDFASKFEFAAYLTLKSPVVHVDIREPDCPVTGLSFLRGDLTALPLPDNSVDLGTCLHVAEHIGLGRYGDKINPNGFEEACSELSRVLAPGGTLLFAVPVGVPKVVFNAHRVLSARQVLDAFHGLALKEFSAITSDDGKYAENVPLSFLDSDPYGCGLFRFTKEAA